MPWQRTCHGGRKRAQFSAKKCLAQSLAAQSLAAQSLAAQSLAAPSIAGERSGAGLRPLTTRSWPP